ncbi:MAG: hypothetical protein ABSG03_28390 [Bryobacteraceae bacterium]|jgi:hypothetical protein
MTLMRELDGMGRVGPAFVVVHPLDDAPETEHLGPMQVTRTVRICLFALRGYLLLMFGLLAFRVAQLAGSLHG